MALAGSHSLSVAAAALLCGFLHVAAPPVPSDAIVLLGGDPGGRAPLAARLWREGVAPTVIVTGAEDCAEAADRLIRLGVAARAIIRECEATSTWENALNAAAIMEERGMRGATLVTSWYHARRSLASFHRAAPALLWSVATPPRPGGLGLRALLRPGSTFLTEAGKLAWYTLRYGISLPADAYRVDQASSIANGGSTTISIATSP